MTNKMMLKMHFFSKKFGHIKKKQYLCTRFFKRSKADMRLTPFWEETVSP